MTERTIHILLADDNSNEHFFFAHAIKSIQKKIKLDFLRGGIELLNYFRSQPSAKPDIVFIDINMSLQNGKECLAAIRADATNDDIPIVMYSTSDAESDINQTYALGADLYLSKPIALEHLSVLLDSVLNLYDKGQLKRGSRDSFVLHMPGD